MNNIIIYFVILIILIMLFFFKINNNLNDINYKYNKSICNNFTTCLSVLTHEKNKNYLYKKYIQLFNQNESSNDFFKKSKISIKIIHFGNNNKDIINNLSKLCEYALNKNIFVWISALYETTLNDEYYIYKQLHKKFPNIGLTLSCSHSSVSDKVNEILSFNGYIRLVKGTYKGNIYNDQYIKKIFIHNANKLSNSNDYHCICTHDFEILRHLNLQKNKQLELSFYFMNMIYVKQNLIKYNINVNNISLYTAYGNKFKTLFDKKIKIPYFYKKILLMNPFHNLFN